jgi:pyridoxamine 5'-phosphate oxidase
MNDDAQLTTVDPIAQFNAWFAEAAAQEPVNPDAAALATADAAGRPSVRMVLVKSADTRGFVFYTNSDSRKGQEMAANPRAALVFYWKSLLRQVRVEGPVSQVPPEEADAYHTTRARASQIGAWASPQSRPMVGRFEFERRIAQFTAKYAVGAVPRPPFWNGYRIAPEQIEFWQERRFRLHDRILYSRSPDGWTAERLYP